MSQKRGPRLNQGMITIHLVYPTTDSDTVGSQLPLPIDFLLCQVVED